MQIVCPDCGTAYQVDPTKLGRSGRKVRCARCKSSWLAAPEAEPVFAMAFSHPDLGSGHVHAASRPAAPADAGEAAEPASAEAEVEPGTNPVAADQADRMADEDGNIQPEHEGATIDGDVVEAADAPPLVPTARPIVIESGGNDIETLAARRAQQISRRRRLRARSNLVLVIAALLAIDAALIAWRANIVRLLPQTASLYAAIGLPVNLRGLTIRDVTISRDTHDGVAMLVIEGEIFNDSTHPVEVPRLRFAALGADKNELYAWTAMPERSVLGAGEAEPFHSRLASPPAEAHNVMVRFLNRRDLIGASQ